jgi:2-amino-4-hydroxy-6-hydroxymethyldihydropteridine diphosphokinase
MDDARDSGQATPVTAYVGLGANLGDRARTIRAGVQDLAAHPAITLLAVSRLVETGAEEVPGPPYLNGAAALATTLSARNLLAVLLAVEKAHGRVRTVRRGPRTLDLDLLLYGSYVFHEPDLDVPHPRLTGRRFVLGPLAEIAPDVMVPETGRTVAAWLARLSGSA